MIELYGVNELRENLINSKYKFHNMVQTMKDVAEVIHANTNQRVPLDTGRLEESFHYEIVENNSEFISVEIGYDAVDPLTHEHYAEIQHEEESFHHPKRGEAFYLINGIHSSEYMIRTIIETDYLSLFN